MEVFKAISISHKNASIDDLAELYQFLPNQKDELYQHVSSVKLKCHLDEAFFLSTCNRLLFIYVCSNNNNETELTRNIVSELFKSRELQTEEFLKKFKILGHNDTIKHVFNLACGMESMVIGEHEILGQVKKAFSENKNHQLIGDNIRILFEKVITAAKDVMTKTELGKHSVSVVALAIEELKKHHFKNNAKIALVGAGETIQLVSKFLLKLGYENIIVFNRTLSKGEHISNNFINGAAKSLSELKKLDINDFDVLISCIDNQANLITENYFTNKTQLHKKLVFIDLAVPSNLSSEIISNGKHVLINMQYLQEISKNNLAKRSDALNEASTLIEKHIIKFYKVFNERKLERLLSEIPTQIKQIKNKAVNEVFCTEIATLDDETRALLFNVINYYEKKAVGIPLIVAKKALNDNKLNVN